MPPVLASATVNPAPSFMPPAFLGVMTMLAAEPTVAVSGVDVNVLTVMDGALSTTGGAATTLTDRRPLYPFQ